VCAYAVGNDDKENERAVSIQKHAENDERKREHVNHKRQQNGWQKWRDLRVSNKIKRSKSKVSKKQAAKQSESVNNFKRKHKRDE